MVPSMARANSSAARWTIGSCLQASLKTSKSTSFWSARTSWRLVASWRRSSREGSLLEGSVLDSSVLDSNERWLGAAVNVAVVRNDARADKGCQHLVMVFFAVSAVGFNHVVGAHGKSPVVIALCELRMAVVSQVLVMRSDHR